MAKERFGDIWQRARHNALANEVAAESNRRRILLMDMLIAELIILPMLSTALYQQLLITHTYNVILATLGSIGGLYLSLVGFVREWRINHENHKRAHAMFNNIAQRARRGGNDLDSDEVKYLLRSLEEMFETAKYNFSEPSDKHYNEGMKRMTNMPSWPFGLDKNKYKQPPPKWKFW